MMGRIKPVDDGIIGPVTPQHPLMPIDSLMLRRRNIWVAAGLFYLVFSFACSVFYLTILVDNVANDFWWRHFNTTGGQTFVADVFNTRLIQGVNTWSTLDLVADSTGLSKDYSGSTTFIDMREPAARQWMLQPQPLDVAVTALRANSLYENVYVITPFCWVDLSRQFEMAHTSGRQRRCLERQTTNAAMYLEALLRNTVVNDLRQSDFGIQINQTILTPMMTLPQGSAWVAALDAINWLSVADEVRVWQQQGLVYYMLQYQNRFQHGIDDKLTIRSALGLAQEIKISTISYIYRDKSSWSTVNIHCGFWNDLQYSINYGASLVRHTANYFETLGHNWDTMRNGPIQTVGIALVRSVLGPLLSLDTQLILPPPSLVALVNAIRVHLVNGIKANATFSAQVFQLVPVGGVTMDLVPPSWAGPSMAYYGGNPLCFSFKTSRPYPQMPFSYYDACQSQT
ncbi:hypothetical protein As57867_004136, partial [Aphanomyces stellatus]